MQLNETALSTNASADKRASVISFVPNASAFVGLGTHKNIFANIPSDEYGNVSNSSGGNDNRDDSDPKTDSLFTVEVWARFYTNGIVMDYRRRANAANQNAASVASSGTASVYPSLAINEGRLAWILSRGDGAIVDSFFSDAKVPMNEWTHVVVSREKKDAPEVTKKISTLSVENTSLSMMNISVGANGAATVTHFVSDPVIKLGALTGLLPGISGGHNSSAKTIGATISVSGGEK